MKPLRIGNLEFAYPVFLAPMAGVSDKAYRILAHEFFCPLVFTEMVSSMGIHFKNEKTLSMLKTSAKERPLAIQIFGFDSEIIAQTAKYIEALGIADIIDFNMGCPAPKIVKNGAGAALLLDLDKATKIMQQLRRAVKLPLTVKIRLGFDENHICAIEMAKRAEFAGIDAIIVHGRTRAAYYSGRADWQKIREVKENVAIPVIANGDIRTIDDLQNVLQITNADGVMIGRAAEGNPWIFKQFITFLKTGAIIPPPTIEERCQVILQHLNMLIEFKGEYIGVREMRKHATWYTRGMKNSATLRTKINQAESKKDFLMLIEKMQMLDINP